MVQLISNHCFNKLYFDIALDMKYIYLRNLILICSFVLFKYTLHMQNVKFIHVQSS